MNKVRQINNKCMALTLLMAVMPLTAQAFVSGSTGSDGAFNPTANTTLTLPPNGIFNFTEVNIPAGVTVSFAKNADNTPVTMLVSGDVSIGGTVNLNGGTGGPFNDGTPGKGGPGGFDGGRGGLRGSTGRPQGGDGQGPGRGTGGKGQRYDAGGGSFGTTGLNGSTGTTGLAGPAYGNGILLPLIGGSGGGGGGGGTNNTGPGGGGGGGALLIAASGTVTVTGSITAVGGNAGARFRSPNATLSSGHAGSGSGGGIRIIATTLQGEGTITSAKNSAATGGGDGRIRLEAETMLRTANTTPNYLFSTPGVVLIANLPALRIASVDGIAAPANPSGHRDIELPGVTNNPVPVAFATANIPLGTVISLTAAPERGTATTASSNAVSGTLASGTASANINLPNGNSILTAQTTFTVTASAGAEFSKYARGEQVEQIKVAYIPGKGSQTRFITASGKEFTWPSNTLAWNN